MILSFMFPESKFVSCPFFGVKNFCSISLRRDGVEIDRPILRPSYVTCGQNTEFLVIKARHIQTVRSEVAQCFCVKVTWLSRSVCVYWCVLQG